MSELEKMHRAVCANPDDDTVRLAYADLLDEQPVPADNPVLGAPDHWDGPVRAAFIRAAVAAQAVPLCGKLAPFDLEDGACSWRCRCPWCRAHRAIRPTVQRYRNWWVYGERGPSWIVYNANLRATRTAGRYSLQLRGGFVSQVALEARVFVDCAGALFAAAPIRSVHLIGAAPLSWLGNVFAWVRGSAAESAYQRQTLPAALFDRIPGEQFVGNRITYKRYKTVSGAAAALEAGALAYGRQERDRLWAA